MLAVVALVGVADPARGDEAPSYNRDIRPILAENCFLCHGPDSSSRKADLRLDQRDSALKIRAIVPGDLAASELIARITADDPEEVMPPPNSHKQLTPEQKSTLRRWIEAGAEYQPHWAFLAPQRVEPPPSADAAWNRTPVDRFLRAKMAEKNLAPNGPADRRALARRVSLDLTGLPPTTAMVEAFVADESPSAYEKLVDTLLASPAWGEHRGRYWLDAARYADTHGIHIDNYREIWSYRDWVINAFNANQPFNQFAIEQLAGDLLPGATLDQQVATGFSRCNITTSEGGAINEEYLVLYARDRTETASQVFLGLTTGCAVCHDHKFDPFSQKEFYELAAFFNNTTQAAMDGNVKDTPPTVFVPPKPDRDRWTALGELIGQAKGKVAARREAAKPEFAEWLKGKDANPKALAATLPRAGLHIQALLDDRDAPAGTPRATLEVAPAGDFERDQAFSFGMWVRPSEADLNGALVARMNEAEEHRGWDLWADGNRIATHIIHRWPTNTLRVMATTKLPANTWTHVLVTYDGSSRAAGVAVFYNGQRQPTSASNDNLSGSIRTGVPLRIGQRESGGQTDPMARFHDLRIYNRVLPDPEVVALSETARAAELLAKPAERRTPDETEAVFGWFLGNRDEPTRTLRKDLATLEGEQAAIRARGTLAHVMHERGEAPTAFVLFRGDYDKRRDQVGADTPDILPPLPGDFPRNRLGLARWLFLPEHPLTARVTVNRFWQELFGVGLVRTTGDLGLSGELPSHPELLDWLALEFRDGGWDVKKFYKMLVMTTAYQQATTTTPDAAERDPQNRYLARGPRFRMDAEMIRDSALAVGGLLSATIGGPSVRPYQPDGVWEAVAMPNSDTHDYRRDAGEKLYRRSMYTMWKRSAPPASMDIMNAPSRETCITRRERTNTPLQALVTLNDEQFVEAARHLAELTLAQPADESTRFDFVARRLLGRPFRDAERAVVAQSFQSLRDHYTAHPAEAAEVVRVGESKADGKLPAVDLAAWTMLCNELMNLDEVLNK